MIAGGAPEWWNAKTQVVARARVDPSPKAPTAGNALAPREGGGSKDKVAGGAKVVGGAKADDGPKVVVGETVLQRQIHMAARSEAAHQPAEVAQPAPGSCSICPCREPNLCEICFNFNFLARKFTARMLYNCS